MVLAFIVLLVVIPLVELYVILQVAHQIGGLDTIGLLIASSIVGGVLLRVQGLGVIRRFRSALAHGELPAAPLVDGLLIGVGGLLMLVPGFVSDTLGLLLLLPPVRAVARRVVLRRARARLRTYTDGPLGRAAGRWVGGDPSGFGRSAPADVIDVDGWEEPPRSGRPMLRQGPRS